MNERLILDLYKDKQHQMDSIDSKISAKYENTSCGDEIVLYQEENGKYLFSGAACSLTLASAEFLCRSLEGKDIQKINIAELKKQLFEAFDMTEDDKRVMCILLPYLAAERLQQQSK